MFSIRIGRGAFNTGPVRIWRPDPSFLHGSAEWHYVWLPVCDVIRDV